MIAAQPELLDEPYLELLDQHMAQRAAILSALSLGSSRSVMAAPPGGALPGEIARLRYPMHRNASWSIRHVPLFTSIVEGPEKEQVITDLDLVDRNGCDRP